MRTGFGGLDHVGGIAQRRRQNLGIEAVVLVDEDNVADQVHAVPTDVVEASYEGADEVRAGFGGEQRLRRREAQRDVHADTLAAENGAGANAIARQRHFHHYVLVNGRELAPFHQHLVGIGRDHFSADIAVDEAANFADLFFHRRAFLRDQRGVGGDSVNNPPPRAGLQLIQVGGVEKKFHVYSLFGLRRKRQFNRL